MQEHKKTYYSLEELKRARDCYEGYQDGEEVYYFVGALRYACDEIERLNNIINECANDILKELNENNHLSYGVAIAIRLKLLDYKELKGVDKECK